MPKFDRTGPEGKGPRTGRNQGKCGSNDSVENKEDNQSNVVRPGNSMGRGKGTGRGTGTGRGKGNRPRNGRNQ